MTDREKRNLDRRDFLRRTATGAVLGGFLLPRDVASVLADLPAPSQGRPFEMLVLGDSIMWGQGLKEEQKFSYRVEQWVRGQLPGIEVHRHVLAHSGAQIKADAAHDDDPPTHGEVPNKFPSITRQLATAQSASFPLHAPLDPRSVALVLLDGGINDFGTKVILNPDPTVGRAWVRDVTRRKCVDRMKELLPAVTTAFPNARVVITNYFQIVSEQSDIAHVGALLGFWEILGDGVTAASAPLRKKMSDQSLAFHEESTAGFREAVAETTRQIATTTKQSAQPRLSGSIGLATRTPSRVAFADASFGPQHAYGAPETMLFYLNEPDPAASTRKPACVAQVPNTSPALPNCLLASTGHPNLNGAAAYARAIIDVAARWVPEWQEAYGVTPPKGPTRGREPVVLRRP